MNYTQSNVGVIDYEYTHVGTQKTKITHIICEFMDGKTIECEDIGEFLETVTNHRARLLFVWDFNFFGAFLDYWALTHNIPLYNKESVARGGNGRSIAQECFSALYTARGMLNFKITLRRTKGTHRQYLKAGVESYHTTEFRGLAPYFGGCRYPDAITACGLSETCKKKEGLLRLLKYCTEIYEKITGEKFLSTAFLSSVYTVGRAARDTYLKTRYKTKSLRAYQKDHIQNQGFEDYLRERSLLLGGMCIINPKYKGALFMRKPPNCFRKYDKNGLYTYIANKVGDLGCWMGSTFDEFYNDKSDNYVYILIFARLQMSLKKGYPRVFTDPFTKIDGDSIELTSEYAIFGELYKMLNIYYRIDDAECVRVFKCPKRLDNAIIEYNRRLLSFKDKGRSEDNRALYLISKVFLNGLLGKFAQATKTSPVTCYYDESLDCVRFNIGEQINQWDKKHFDYVRGAYIYTMARVEMLKDFLALFKGCKSISSRHWYTDTDSIVTDITFPPEYVHPSELGKYKVEAEYSAFGIIGKKMYYGRLLCGEDKLTCAGLPKEDIIEGFRAAFPLGLSPYQFFDYLNHDNGMPMHIAVRCSGGSMIATIPYTIKFVNTPLEF